MGDPAGRDGIVTRGVIPGGLDASLVLVRHGETTWLAERRFQGASNPPLSAVGERQAALVAARLAQPLANPPLPVPDGDPVGCWHSPLDRAASVARAIADRRSPPLPLHVEPRLREIGHGRWEGRLHAEIAADDGPLLAAWRDDPTHHHAPGGEAVSDAAARVADALRELLEVLAASSDASAAAADHATGTRRAASPGRGAAARPGAGTAGAVGTAAVAPPVPWAIVVAHDGVLRLSTLALLDLPLERFWSFPFAPCGISVVSIRGGRPALRAHNLVDHLAALDGQGAARAAVEGEESGTQ